MINLLDKNFELPLNCYALSVMFFKTNFIMRNMLLTLLRLTGNGRISNSAKNIKPLSRD
jgi:hypothetical protein